MVLKFPREKFPENPEIIEFPKIPQEKENGREIPRTKFQTPTRSTSFPEIP